MIRTIKYAFFVSVLCAMGCSNSVTVVTRVDNPEWKKYSEQIPPDTNSQDKLFALTAAHSASNIKVQNLNDIKFKEVRILHPDKKQVMTMMVVVGKVAGSGLMAVNDPVSGKVYQDESLDDAMEKYIGKAKLESGCNLAFRDSRGNLQYREITSSRLF